MNLDQLDWTSGLDQSGWIAAGLFVIFFIITIIVIVMMLRLNADNKKQARKKKLNPVSDLNTTSTKPAVKARQTPAEQANKKVEAASLIEEAEVFLTYGLNKQATDLLEKHLEKNPSDEAAREMLFRAQAE